MILGRPELAAFITMPVEALEIVDDLAAGYSVADARDRFTARHGEEPDIHGLIAELERRGFLWPADDAAAPPPEPVVPPGHFEGFPRRLAQHLFGRAALTFYAIIIALAAIIVITDPSVRPSWHAMFFPERLILMVPLLLTLNIGAVFIHEMAHLVAAKAAGISSRLGIGTRLFVLVAEADLTGLWAVPKRDRYLPLLAGMIADAVSLSCLLLVLEANHLGFFALPDFGRLLLRALTLRYVLALVWQFFFFVRTDLYYVFASALGQTNLLGDTEAYLRDRVRRGWSLVRACMFRDRDATPAGPASAAIRAYAVFWIIGRVAAMGVLVLVQIPLALRYFHFLAASLDPASAAPPRPVAIVMSTLALTLLLLGPVLWLFTVLKKRIRP